MSARPIIGDFVPLGQTPTGPFSALACTAPVQATGVLTSNNTNVTAGDTVTIGFSSIILTYTFVNALSAQYTAGQVLKGSSADDSLTNLGYAVNNTSNQAGIKFYGRLANPYVTASAVSAHAVTFTAISTSAEWLGSNGNLISTTTSNTGPTLTWGATTLAGGVAGVLEVSGAGGGGIPVSQVGAAHGAVTVIPTTGQSAGTSTVAARSTRVSALIQNYSTSAETLWFGYASGVNASTGVQLAAGQSCPEGTTAAMFFFSVSGTATGVVIENYN